MTVVEEYAAEIMKLVLSMTLTGSIISVFLFILKPVIKDKLPKAFQYYMWFSVVIALILPISKIIVVPISDQTVMPMKSVYDISQWISDTASEKPVNLEFTLQDENEQNGQEITYSPSMAVILFIFWQFGMILVLGFHMICYASYVRRLKEYNTRAEQREIELLDNLLERKHTLRLYKNSIVKTPILIGFFYPTVILPGKKYDDMKLRNILMHEIAHMERHDIFIKWLLIFAGSIHWFNPLVYFVRREMNKACELACDEFVIKRFDIFEMQQYGDTLIAVAADSIRKMPFPITMFEDKRNLKERLDAIMKHKKYSKRTVIAASVILITIVCAILGFSTLHGVENISIGHSYADNFPLPQDQKRIKEIELTDALRNYDKNNISGAYVFLGDSDGEIAHSNIIIIYREKIPNFEMQSEIKSLVSEKIGLDIQNIYIDYIDFESFTSGENLSEDSSSPLDTLQSQLVAADAISVK